jgi:hypothetical protein
MLDAGGLRAWSMEIKRERRERREKRDREGKEVAGRRQLAEEVY